MFESLNILILFILFNQCNFYLIKKVLLCVQLIELLNTLIKLAIKYGS